ncbi:molybdenum ABC transporter, periplasmic molybdate-binding protein [Xenococcus sp. PCC 7305]|uniref:molybdate ABC transporter substrate-binding protein n=1 Tax=Xenococcus sp. PCC 7305 TaxID=102125 RepID=UPI0002AC9FA0|nr:molybdate ABC transporter substrate-binding protein [Xenococcus sp. PCC 7305]ELS00740.1 molybdenum ABC transporter, periplasmic molybdate-binding protein [Xenococcus sp. PCC 7305]
MVLGFKVIIKQKILGFLSISVLSLLLVLSSDRIQNVQLGNPSQANSSTQLTVSAAASLKNVIEAIEPLYEQKYPETKIIYNFASSGSLQRQIEQGAPVDIFISAAVDKMDSLEKKDLLLTQTRQDLLKNQVVLVAPKENRNNSLQLESFADLTTNDITTIALGEPNSVPAGQYAQEVLTSFEIADQVNTKAVYAKDVRQVLNYVATGNVDAGIVYRTDAQDSEQVQIVATAPEISHSPVVYPVAVLKDSDRPEAATELIEFFTTPEAQAIFEKYGFDVVINH